MQKVLGWGTPLPLYFAQSLDKIGLRGGPKCAGLCSEGSGGVHWALWAEGFCQAGWVDSSPKRRQ